jgi:hypothetical protein
MELTSLFIPFVELGCEYIKKNDNLPEKKEMCKSSQWNWQPDSKVWVSECKYEMKSTVLANKWQAYPNAMLFS